MSVLNDPPLEALLAELHARSDAQISEIDDYYAHRSPYAGALSQDDEARVKQFRSDKLVALDRDKAEFCYLLCRASQARRVVEAGTSYGVSTLYLAAAVRDTIRASGGTGVVIGTEYEPAKAAAARQHFAQAGLEALIDLREGDLRETLRHIDGPIDFMLADIWTPMARPALELVAPHLRPGAMVVCDNTAQHRAAYADYFAFLEDPANGFRTMTLPFGGGLELSVRCRP
ncbi:MAG TPA: class I SAM-dependent methyltransferase [Acetobacteraceae bacterium]|nr:class I SAM-dependent methyltransferase [Acetobacteraceae bacterium]